MVTIKFRAKKITACAVNDDVDYGCVNVPKLKSSHCDINAFRPHEKYGGYTNSQLFEGILARIRKGIFPTGELRLDEIPEGVTVDTSRFLVKASFGV